MTCVNCGASVASGAKFCDNCGTTLAADGRVRGPVMATPGMPSAVATQTPSYAAAVPGAVVVRNPGLALVLSLFFPGAGQMYNGQVGKGVGMLIGYFLCLLLAALVLPLFAAIGIWIWAMADAYQTAKLNPVQRPQ